MYGAFRALWRVKKNLRVVGVAGARRLICSETIQRLYVLYFRLLSRFTAIGCVCFVNDTADHKSDP
jgi:hypothetical protein